MGPSHTQESVAQLRQLDGTACVICGTIRSRRGNRCNHCRTDTATRDRVVGKKFQDRRQPDHPGATTSLPTRHPLSTRSQPIPQGEPLDESPLPNGPNPRHESSRSVTHSCLATFTELQRWPVREPLFPLRERAWREPSVVTSPPPSCADIAADDCGPKFPRRPTATQYKNSVHRCGMRENVTIWLEEFQVGQQNREKKPCSRRPKNSGVNHTARGSITDAMKGLVGGAAAGSAER